MLVLAVVSGFGSIAKYFARETFWGFCITQLVFGFFLGNLPIAMAYIGDVFTSKTEKGRQLSIIVANYVMGNSGGPFSCRIPGSLRHSGSELGSCFFPLL
jgi:MFS family permease